MVQAVFMCATCLGAIPSSQEVLGVSYGVALSMVIINGSFYTIHVLLGDPVVPGWITPAIPLITAFLPTDTKWVPSTQALIALQLILGIIFLMFGITGMGGKMVDLVPNSVKAGVLMGGGFSAIIGESSKTGSFLAFTPFPSASVCWWPTSASSVPYGPTCAGSIKAIDLIGKFGMLPAIIIGVVLGPL